MSLATVFSKERERQKNLKKEQKESPDVSAQRSLVEHSGGVFNAPTPSDREDPDPEC